MLCSKIKYHIEYVEKQYAFLVHNINKYFLVLHEYCVSSGLLRMAFIIVYSFLLFLQSMSFIKTITTSL